MARRHNGFFGRAFGLDVETASLTATGRWRRRFLGYIVRPHYCLVRHRVVKNLRQCLHDFAAAHVKAQGMMLEPLARDKLRARLASYLGHFQHARSYRLI